MRKQIDYSFQQMCIDTNRTEILDRWDYDKNEVSPDQVAARSNIKRWLKCPRGIHDSELYDCDHITKNKKFLAPCKACNSLAQKIIDDYGEEYLNKIWSSKNDKTPWDYSVGSNKRPWFICIDNPEHEYQQVVFNRVKGCGCPHCNNRDKNTEVLREKSLGVVCPESIFVWSEDNDSTPYDYSPSSGQSVLWKCENNKHDDYKRKICNSKIRGFKCPTCAVENINHPRGENHPNWKGGTTPQDKTDRQCQDYNEWRKEVYERDDYTCQVCLDKSHTRLRAHHIYNFADYPSMRFDVQNGITCCVFCHDNAQPGAFHNLYGTRSNTPEQFEEYVNNKRKELGINIPFNIYEFMSSLEDDDMEIDDYGLDL